MSEEPKTAQQKYRENNREKINEYEKIRRKININLMKYTERRSVKKIQNDTINIKKKVRISFSIYRYSRKNTLGITRNITNNIINPIMKTIKNEF